MVLLDFAVNYSFLIQDAIQEYHWNNSLATLYHFVVYRRDNQILTVESFCVIPDRMKHDSNAVHAFLGKILNLLKNGWSTFQKWIISEMVPANIIRTRKNVPFFATMCQIFNLLLSGIFAATHGKSPWDGIGGIVKCLVANASGSR